MERKLFWGQYLIWVILLLGQLHGYKSCIQKERKALLELKQYLTSISFTEEWALHAVPSAWTNDTKSDCCRWMEIKCNPTSGRVIEIAIGRMFAKESSLLNLSLLHPFEEVRSLKFPVGASGLFDDVEGYKSLGRLRNLEILDLSANRFNNSIFPFLDSATSLKTLFLGGNNLDGPFPANGYKSLGRLRNLEILDLSDNRFNNSIFPFLDSATSLKTLFLRGNNLEGPFPANGYKSLGRLRNLDLSRNRFNSSIFPFLNSAATSLTSLFLRENNLDGPFPAKELKDLTNLQLLDLSENRFNGSILIQDLSPLRKLKALDLSNNEFSGSMELQGICEMKNMQDLDLSGNKLGGRFPLCLTGLKRLRVLDLSSNQLIGNVPSALGNLESLKYLSLFNNSFEGLFLVGSLANLSELRVLKLGSRSNSFQLESQSSWTAKFQLNVIALPSCNLVKVPYFLIHQKDLSRIDLSDNIISGIFPYWLLANNTKLESLILQNNLFTGFQLQKSAHNLLSLDVSANKFTLLPENIGWILSQLVLMNISSNSFQGYLPSSLGNMKRIRYLDISHNSFQGKLPRSFVMGCSSLMILTLSHNKLSGEVFPESANFTDIWELYMDNNQFTGKIGPGLRSFGNFWVLDISNNSLSGVIPSWIGELTSLRVLSLSKNLLEGEIPVSLFNLTRLELLDLSANTLSGGIPPHVNSVYAVVLLLQDNNLSGVIPDTLLTNVSVLDLRNNRLSGNIPEFTNTQKTHTLLLRENSLTGSIPRQLCGLRNIQLLDLANNRLSGSIPSCLSNTSFVLEEENLLYDYHYGSIVEITYGFGGFSPPKDFFTDDSYLIYFKSPIVLDPFGMQYTPNTQIKIEFATKHRYDAYGGGNLKLLFGMDLSENELSGEIPVELGGLLKLQALNLSHNNLSGVIPESFSGLKNVESLDLSFNRLQGGIPPQLAELSNLAVFNVSFNNLSGFIPQGRQFNTFDQQSYLGNPLLRGQSINKSFDSIQEPENGVDVDESRIDLVSFYWSFAAAYVTILLGILASLSFDSPWSRAWFYIVDVFIHKVRNVFG